MAEAAIRQLSDVFQQFLTAQQANVAAPAQPTQSPNLANFDCFGLGDHVESDIEGWLERFALALDCSAPNLQDELKVKLLLTKLSETAYAEYSKHCLPKKPTEFDFTKTSEMLLSLFAKQQSVWINRYVCLKAEKQDEEDFRGFIIRHKRLLSDFEFKKLNEQQFNCLMLLVALKSPKDAELRKRILSKLAADGDRATYENVVNDIQMFLSTISEAKAMERPSNSNILAVKRRQQPRRTISEKKAVSTNHVGVVAESTLH
ncbi:hypothetical protein niasHT_017610 [Heterodera trifolii]|uniref:DUF7083 domain-containing protein n=1 Tax=Heterodera trifolii TaxID=157864 RepID=A0ABD2L0F5_9BILA